MKNLYIVLALFISGTAFGQIEQDVNKNTGTESNPINEIDSIRFDPGQTQMQVILNNGSAIIHTIEDIDNVTFSGEILGEIESLVCSGAIINGTLVDGVIASGVSAEIDYTGGNGGSHNGQTVNSTGVTGLTAELTSGNFANGAGTLTYDITGTPNSDGTASFAIDIGGQTCTLEITVDPGSVSTLDCTGAIINGTLVDGVIASGVSAEIDYTGGNGGSHNGQTITSTGVNGLTATLGAGNFATGAGTLTYTITGTPSSDGTANFAINIGGETCTLEITVDQGSVSTLDCAGAIINGTLVDGLIASGVSAEIDYTGGNGGSHNGQTVNSTGVTGLTAELTSGNFANGAGTLTYDITGTPNSDGTASFAIDIGEQTCTLEITVDPGSVSTLDCSGAIINGTLVDGVTASGVSAEIDYTGGNGGSHNGQTITSTGVNGLTATLGAGNFATGAGTLTYTITGTPSSDGTANFAIDIGGETCTLEITVDPGSVSVLDCAGANVNGTLVDGVAANNVTADISYTGGNGGPHNGQTVTSTGVIGLTATLGAGNFATGSGTLSYTITGTPSSDGIANFAIDIGGVTCTLEITVDPGSVSTLDCSGAIINGTLVDGVSASGVSAEIAYTGGNGGPHNGQTITSTGVTGLTATLTNSNFANGAGSLTYSITGTPNSSGTASFAIQIGGISCTLELTVDAGAISTLDCAGASINGILEEGVAANNFTAEISYTGGNGGSHNGQTVSSTGVTGLTAILTAGNFANGAGVLTYNITGTPNSSGNANFTIQIGGLTCTFSIEVLQQEVITISISGTVCCNRNVTLTGNSINATDVIWSGPNGFSETGSSIQINYLNDSHSGVYTASFYYNGVLLDQVNETISFSCNGNATFRLVNNTCSNGEESWTTEILTSGSASGWIWSNTCYGPSFTMNVTAGQTYNFTKYGYVQCGANNSNPNCNFTNNQYDGISGRQFQNPPCN